MVRPVPTVALAVLAFVVFLGAVQSLLESPADRNDPGVWAETRDARVFVLVIDALRADTIELVPSLSRFAAGAFRVEIEPCLDRLTIPCINEGFSGVARQGILGPFRNLVSGGGGDSSNLFHDLQSHGLEVGAVHRGELRAFSTFFSVERLKDEATVAATKALLASDVDLVIEHHSEFDNATHRSRFGTKKYEAALRALDKHVSAVLTAVPPDRTVVILGDHGHTDAGRHIQGLDVPTVFLGPREHFSDAPSERVPIASYRFLVGSLFGVLPPPHYEGLNLAAVLPAGSEVRALAERSTYEGPSGPGRFPLWGFVPAVALVALAAHRGKWPRWAVVLGVVLVVALGLAYLPTVERIHYNKAFPRVDSNILGVMAVLAGIASVLRRPAWVGFGALAIGLLLPGTVNGYGLVQNLGVLLIGAAFVAGWEIVPKSITWRERAIDGVAFAIAALSLYALTKIKSSNLRITHWWVFEGVPAWASGPAWAIVVACAMGGGRLAVAGGLCALVGGSGLVVLEGWPLLPITLATVVAAFRWPKLLWWIAPWVASAWYEPRNSLGIAVLCGGGLALAHLAHRAPTWARTAGPFVVAGLAYLGLALTVGVRASGMDFAFAVPWFPSDWHEKLWFLVVAAMMVKTLLPVVLTSRLFSGDILRDASAASGLRLGLHAVFFGAAFLLARTVPVTWALDLWQDLMAWALIAGVLALAGRGPIEATSLRRE